MAQDYDIFVCDSKVTTNPYLNALLYAGYNIYKLQQMGSYSQVIYSTIYEWLCKLPECFYLFFNSQTYVWNTQIAYMRW